MMNKSKKLKVQKNIICRKTIFEGSTISSKSDLCIKGRTNCNILCATDIVIKRNALVEGNIKAKNVYIYGTVKGIVKAEHAVRIFSCGKIMGIIEAEKIVHKKGSVFFDLKAKQA